MKIKILISVSLLILTCNLLKAQSEPMVGSFETTIIFNGEPSNVAYFVPLDYDPEISYKLIVGLHYCTGTSSAYISYRNLLQDLSISLNAIIMCPDCHMPGYPYEIPDSSIINKSTDSTRALYNINEEYIYLTGGSCNGRTAIKYGLEYIYDYRGVIAFNPYVPSIPANYYDYDSDMPTVICSGTLDPSYNNSVRLYDSLIAYNANAKLISMEGVGHDFWIPEFNIEMMNGIHYIDSITDIIASVDKIKKHSRIKVYPNPAGDFISIQFTDQLKLPIEVTILNLSGRFVNTSLLDSGSSQIDISNLPAGVYFIRIIIDQEILIQKFIKS